MKFIEQHSMLEGGVAMVTSNQMYQHYVVPVMVETTQGIKYGLGYYTVYTFMGEYSIK